MGSRLEHGEGRARSQHGSEVTPHHACCLQCCVARVHIWEFAVLDVHGERTVSQVAPGGDRAKDGNDPQRDDYHSRRSGFRLVRLLRSSQARRNPFRCNQRESNSCCERARADGHLGKRNLALRKGWIASDRSGGKTLRVRRVSDRETHGLCNVQDAPSDQKGRYADCGTGQSTVAHFGLAGRAKGDSRRRTYEMICSVSAPALAAARFDAISLWMRI